MPPSCAGNWDKNALSCFYRLEEKTERARLPRNSESTEDRGGGLGHGDREVLCPLDEKMVHLLALKEAAVEWTVGLISGLWGPQPKPSLERNAAEAREALVRSVSRPPPRDVLWNSGKSLHLPGTARSASETIILPCAAARMFVAVLAAFHANGTDRPLLEQFLTHCFCSPCPVQKNSNDMRLKRFLMWRLVTRSKR